MGSKPCESNCYCGRHRFHPNRGHHPNGTFTHPKDCRCAVHARLARGGGRKPGWIGWVGADNPNWKGGISRNNYHYKLIQIERYPEKHAARIEVSKAYKRGDLIKQPCCVCGANNKKSEFHHFSYLPEFALSGYFVCRKHHIIFDNFLRAGIDIGKYFQFALPVLSNGYLNCVLPDKIKVFKYNSKQSAYEISKK